ncbi:DNA polymerase alpha subunit B isoform X2 [Phlebotomus argentipes]|uniref:DNA polymerase alpha subunit B isoform X2 n=1 Tax=Phlebotomus argentipes TaxID=94469 RepID=UPI0028930C7C|nr:DNA polymerase alpha subunit B isoform X2 [Phlebotomus argentipes]
MISVEDLSREFDELGIEPNTEVLSKCIEIAGEHNLQDAVEFVEMWMAFSISCLGGAEPTVATLMEFERKEIVSKKVLQKGSSRNQSDSTTRPGGDLLKIYSGSTEKPTEKILDAYSCYSPQVEAKTRPGGVEVNFSPASYSPLTSSKEKSSDEKSGKIVYTFGSAQLLQSLVWESQATGEKILVQQIPLNIQDQLLEPTERYMYDGITEKSLIAGERLDDIASGICNRAFTEDAEEPVATGDTPYEGEEYEKLSQVNYHSQAVVRCVGRVSHDNTASRLSATSSILIGNAKDKMSSVTLNFNRIPSVSLFPGQIVLAKGMNPTGKTLFLQQLFSERYWDPPRAPSHLKTPLKLLIAAGPFAENNDLVCEPLQDLMTQCKQLKPDILILIGPFVDVKNSCIADGLLAESFDSFFQKLINGVVSSIGDHVEILVVASQRDAHSSMVYPTHPYSIPGKPKNVTFLPDPCFVEISGVKFGITATDIVNHIAEEEFTKNAAMDKVKRIVGYLINQKSFYPLDPPAHGVNMDSRLAHRFARIRSVPHVFILPSEMKCFVRDVGGCLAINPGRVVETTRGTFARLVVSPPSDGATPKDFMACRIMRV